MKKMLLILAIVCLGLAFTANLWADAWQEVNSGVKPPARAGHTMVTLNGALYLFGGYSPQSRGDLLFNDLWRFDFEDNSWSEVAVANPPAKRKFHAAAVSHDKMYIFFGIGADPIPFYDVWSYNPATNVWMREKSEGMLPAPRYGHSAVNFSDGSIVIHGGKLAGGQYADDFAWKYCPELGNWERRNYTTIGRYGHSAVMYNEKMYVFGGTNRQNQWLQDVWSFDPAQNVWAQLSIQGEQPVVRANHAAASQNDLMWIFGGNTTGGQELSDTWEFNLTTLTWTAKSAMPIPLNEAKTALTTSSSRDVRPLLFGGVSNGALVDRTFQYLPQGNPQTEKMVWNQVGVLGKGNFSFLYLGFAKKQEKVTVQVEWAQADAELRLFTFKLPWFLMSHRLAEEFMIQEDEMFGRDSESQESEHWENWIHKKFGRMEMVPEKSSRANNRGKIEVTLNKVRMVVLQLVHKHRTATARDIQVKVTDFTDNPKHGVYLFPIGNPDHTNTPANHFVRVPVVPVRWHFGYPPCVDIDHDTETTPEYWKWYCIDRTKRFRWFGTLRFTLPE